MLLEGKKIAYPIEDGFEDLDFRVPESGRVSSAPESTRAQFPVR